MGKAARRHADDPGAARFEIMEEILAPVVILPFASAKRADVFKKGNYVCIAKPK